MVQRTLLGGIPEGDQFSSASSSDASQPSPTHTSDDELMVTPATMEEMSQRLADANLRVQQTRIQLEGYKIETQEKIKALQAALEAQSAETEKLTKKNREQKSQLATLKSQNEENAQRAADLACELDDEKQKRQLELANTAKLNAALKRKIAECDIYEQSLEQATHHLKQMQAAGSHHESSKRSGYHTNKLGVFGLSLFIGLLLGCGLAAAGVFGFGLIMVGSPVISFVLLSMVLVALFTVIAYGFSQLPDWINNHRNQVKPALAAEKKSETLDFHTTAKLKVQLLANPPSGNAQTAAPVTQATEHSDLSSSASDAPSLALDSAEGHRRTASLRPTR